MAFCYSCLSGLIHSLQKHQQKKKGLARDCFCCVNLSTGSTSLFPGFSPVASTHEVGLPVGPAARGRVWSLSKAPAAAHSTDVAGDERLVGVFWSLSFLDATRNI